MSRQGCSQRSAWRTAIIVAAALGAAGASTRAQSTPTQDAAALAQRSAGIEHLRAGRAEEAVAAFQHSLALVESPNTRLDLGRAFVALGRHASALRELERARDTAEARIASGQRQYEGTRRAAATEADAIRADVPTVELSFAQPPPPGTEVEIGGSRLPTAAIIAPVPVDPGPLRVRLRGPAVREQVIERTLAAGSHERVRFEIELVGYLRLRVVPEPPGLSVEVDRHALQRGDVGAEMPVAPGAHTLSASAPGYEHATQSRTIAAGEHAAVELELVPTAGSRVRVVPPASGGGLGPVQWAGVATATVGVLGVLGGLITWSASDDIYTQLDRDCGPLPCTTRAQFDRLATGEFLETTSVVLFVGGSVLAATGLIMVIAGPSQRPARPRATPAVEARVGGLAVHF